MDTLVSALDKMVSRFEKRPCRSLYQVNEAGLQATLQRTLAEAYGLSTASMIPERSGLEGFYDPTRRTVSEYATQLGFDSHEFEK